MGEELGQIARDIEDKRRQIGANLEELEQKAEALTDWREYYRDRPALFLGAAVGAGLLVGALTASRSTRPEPEWRPIANPAAPALRSRVGQQLNHTWRDITDALLGVASAKVVEFVGDRVPGFREHYVGPHQSGPPEGV